MQILETTQPATWYDESDEPLVEAARERFERYRRQAGTARGRLSFDELGERFAGSATFAQIAREDGVTPQAVRVKYAQHFKALPGFGLTGRARSLRATTRARGSSWAAVIDEQFEALARSDTLQGRVIRLARARGLTVRPVLTAEGALRTKRLEIAGVRCALRELTKSKVMNPLRSPRRHTIMTLSPGALAEVRLVIALVRVRKRGFPDATLILPAEELTEGFTRKGHWYLRERDARPHKRRVLLDGWRYEERWDLIAPTECPQAA